jgi:hypothetical protein
MYSYYFLIAVVCSEGPNIFTATSPHVSGASGTLMEADIVARIDGGVGVLNPATVPQLLTGQSYELELVSGAFFFRGFLQRLSGTDTDLSGSFVIPAGETNAQLLASIGEGSFGGGAGGLATCPATVAGATHLNGRTDKASVKTTIEIPANQVGEAVLEITVMVSTRVWYYSTYSFVITDPTAATDADAEDTEPPTDAPQVTEPPAAAGIEAPTASPEDSVSSHLVLSLWVGLIMLSAPVYFL